MNRLKITGVIVPMLTPFKDGAVDDDGIAALADFLIARGVSGVFPLGTTGEGPLLTVEERKHTAEVAIRAVAGRIPVIIHTGVITTDETIELSRHAAEAGADAVAVVPPYFYKLSDEAIYEHFAAVARALPDYPIYLYNNPGVTPNVLTTDLVVRLANAFPNLIGLKDSGGALATLFASRGLHDGAFNTASGPDGLIAAAQAVGVDACVSGNANFVPELVVGLLNAAKRGDMVEARLLQAQLDEVRRLLGDGSDLSIFKAMCARRGVAVGDVRAPLKRATAEKIEASWQAITALGVIPVEA